MRYQICVRREPHTYSYFDITPEGNEDTEVILDLIRAKYPNAEKCYLLAAVDRTVTIIEHHSGVIERESSYTKSKKVRQVLDLNESNEFLIEQINSGCNQAIENAKREV